MDTTFELENQVFNFRVAGVWIENGHVLLHKQAGDLHWALPGGRAQMQEESKACLEREMKEELDVAVEVDRLLCVVENFFSYDGRKFHEIGFYYLIHGTEDQPYFQTGSFHGPEGKRLLYQWVPFSEVPQMALQPEFLRKALSELPGETQHVIVSN
ncbi:NUDIX hydrolase [Planococcus sp. YIM B11945]|uniref:NUDIX hydrolase n=1 Tax=Planococcus sp. YIM B11945 TaxID=3435410 RepID=UPI003D7DA941